MELNKLSMSKRLLIAPLVVIVLLLVLSVVAYLGLARQKVALDEIYHQRFKSYQNVAQVLEDVSAIHANVYRMISWTNAKFDQSKLESLSQEQIGSIGRLVELGTKVLGTDAGAGGDQKTSYQATLESLLTYEKQAKPVLEMIQADVNTATMMMGSCDDTYIVLEKQLRGLLEIEDRRSKEQYDASADRLGALLKLFAVVLLFAIVASVLISLFVARRITRPLETLVDGLTEGAEEVSSASAQVSTASLSLAEGSSQQAAGIEEISSSIEEMASMTRQNADNASHANTLMAETGTVMEEANVSMKELTRSMNEISAASEETGKIIKTIDEIAFQTNLLALNAAVEAARAGEVGAGFAVVADEVRNLAMRAADAARNTANLIEGTVKKIKHGSETVDRTDSAFGKVASGARKVGELVGEIAAASQEQAHGIEQINKAVIEMDRVIQKSAASAEESASASQKMSGQAERMQSFVGDLVALMGKGNGNGSHGSNSLPSVPADAGNDRRPVLRAPASAGRAAKEGPVKRELRPEEVIPMEADGEDEF